LLPSAGLPLQEGWYIGGGGFVKSPLLWRLLFVLFLPTQEKNIFICYDKRSFIYDLPYYTPPGAVMQETFHGDCPSTD
jgi:hypothetical protein